MTTSETKTEYLISNVSLKHDEVQKSTILFENALRQRESIRAENITAYLTGLM